MRRVTRSLILSAASAALVFAVGHLIYHYVLVGDAYVRLIFF
jgi:hypothetical protein